jgi:hypothetical protein
MSVSDYNDNHTAAESDDDEVSHGVLRSCLLSI